MKFHEQSLDGVFLVEPEPFGDERGIFRRHFCENEFSKNGMPPKVMQANVSENKLAGTLRGFHYQIEPFSEGKTLSCLKGKIYDIVVDLRPTSKSYLKWQSFELNDINKLSLHIAPGCANAFLTLTDNCLIHYYCSHSYRPEAERGVRFDDPLFQFQWPVEPLIISEKDKSHPNFKIR